MDDAEIQQAVRYHVQRHHLSQSDILEVPEFRDGIERLKRGDASAVEWAVTYLELRPYHFRSGYLKNTLLRYLRHVTLKESHKERLHDYVIMTIEAGDYPSRKQFSALARRLDTPRLRERLLAISESQSTSADVAARVLEVCKMNDYRTDLRDAR